MLLKPRDFREKLLDMQHQQLQEETFRDSTSSSSEVDQASPTASSSDSFLDFDLTSKLNTSHWRDIFVGALSVKQAVLQALKFKQWPPTAEDMTDEAVSKIIPPELFKKFVFQNLKKI